jgi:type I restriction enzyme M protein
MNTNKEQEKRITKLSHKSIFGTDANPRMARVSKMNMIMHGDGHNGIHHNDGLLNVNGIFRNRFDVIITNPPFGTNLDKKFPTVENDDKYSNQEMIEKYTQEYGDIYTAEMNQVLNNINEPIRGLFEVGKTSGATEVLFIERCLDLLKPNGRMGIVLPEGVLNSSNLQKVRDYFESVAKIILIVSLPQDVFISSGASVKTSLVFFKKFSKDEKNNYKIIKDNATTLTDDKYKNDLIEINKKLKLKGEEALSKEQKAQLKKDKKTIENKKLVEIKQIIKQEFDYEIPISKIDKAGITTTGQKGENQLPELLKIFSEYKTQNNLW